MQDIGLASYSNNLSTYRILENGLHISLDDVVGQVAHKGCERRLLCATKKEEQFKERN
jgi:hypothetical protein